MTRHVAITALALLAGCARAAPHDVAVLQQAAPRAQRPCIRDGQVQSNFHNDPSRRGMYPRMHDAAFDSLAFANCWTVTGPVGGHTVGANPP